VVEYDESKEHRDEVETVLLRLMRMNGALETLSIFEKAEDNSHVSKMLAAELWNELVNASIVISSSKAYTAYSNGDALRPCPRLDELVDKSSGENWWRRRAYWDEELLERNSAM